MTLLFLSACILFLRIIFSVFTGEGGFLIKAVYKLTSYYGMFLISLLVIRITPGLFNEAFSAFRLIVLFVLAAFVIRRSRPVGRALENAMSGVLVTHVFLAILSAAPIGQNAGLCFAFCIGYYDLWFLAVIGSEYEYRYSSRVFEIVCAAVLLFISASVCGGLIFRISFYERYGLKNLISIAAFTIMTIYSPAVITAAFVMEEKNRLVRLNPFFMYKEKKAFRKEREKQRQSSSDWDYYYKGEKRNSQGRADSTENAGRENNRKDDCERGRKSSYNSYRDNDFNRSKYDTGSNKGYNGNKGNGSKGNNDSGNDHRDSSYNSYNSKSSKSSGSSYLNDELRQAMRIFGIESISGISKKELESRRRELMKKYHPDSGKTGNSHKAGEINAAFDLLKRYMS